MGLKRDCERLRRYITRRVRGEQDTSALERKGLRLGRNVYTARGVRFDDGFLRPNQRRRRHDDIR